MKYAVTSSSSDATNPATALALGDTAAAAGNVQSLPDGSGSSSTITVAGAENGHIEECSEYRFFLHRHWSLFEAMFHSPYIATKLAVWQSQGTLRLQEMLAKMGIPLQQCRQSFQFMEPSVRNHLRSELSNPTVKELYGLSDPDVFYKSFYRYNSFRNPIAAADVVLAATALLELYGTETQQQSNDSESAQQQQRQQQQQQLAAVESSTGHAMMPSGVSQGGSAVGGKICSIDAFNEAYDCLAMRSESLLKKGIQSALDLQRVRRD